MEWIDTATDQLQAARGPFLAQVFKTNNHWDLDIDSVEMHGDYVTMCFYRLPTKDAVKDLAERVIAALLTLPEFQEVK
ncbi:MAG TPA: hypothetical protein VLH56_19430 [Dissulfurispiraceae bacterium]|nr:hypothetical protein [Dissulfurispiraceae bacterium]